MEVRQHVGDRGVHAVTALRAKRTRQAGTAKANAASNIAAPSGSQYNSSIGRRLCCVSATGSSLSISR